MLQSSLRALAIAVALSLGVAPMATGQQSIRPLTLARLDQFIKGLEAEKAFWSPIWAKDKRISDSLSALSAASDPTDPGGFRKKREQYEACEGMVSSRDAEVTRFQQTLQAAMQKMTPKQMADFGAVAHPVTERLEAAEAAGDDARLAAAHSELAAMYAKHFSMNAAEVGRMIKRVTAATRKECGRKPRTLSREEQDSVAAAEAERTSGYTAVSDTLTSDVGERASGLGDNYALLRELIAMFLDNEENGMSEADYNSFPDGFNKAERAVIRQRMAKLKPLMTFLENRGWDS